MISRIKHAALALTLAIVSFSGPGATPASADIVYRPFQQFPYCEEARVSERIRERFNWAEHKHGYYGVEIAGIDRQHERHVVAFGQHPIERRYCKARAALSNGRYQTIHYRIEKGMGLAGVGWNVEFCIPGRDRWHVHGGWCRSVNR
ncbi:MAG: hypothetical protein KDJ51_03095 [Nitratireductor sp.]|nr:hypothetical protein [Nitratireductor sp.]